MLRAPGLATIRPLLWLLATALLVGCGTVRASGEAAPAGASVRDLSPAQLAEALETKDFFFVNTHVPYLGEIAQTDAFIPYDETQQRLGEYPADKTARIVVYCMSGHMSAIAAEALVQAGYTNVWNLAGGMTAWQEASYPLVGKSPAP